MVEARLDLPRGVLDFDHVVAIVGSTEWTHAVRRLELVALRAAPQLRDSRVQVTTAIVSTTTGDLLLRQCAHSKIILTL
jgi:hypothetical protein